MEEIRNNNIKNCVMLCTLLFFSLHFADMTYGYISGDAGIYFPFCKNFFDVPFSYSKGNVNYGGSSTIWLILISIVYHLFPNIWFFLIKAFGFALIFTGIFIVIRGLNSSLLTLPGCLLAFSLCNDIIRYTGSGFETGLIIFSLCLLLYFLFKENYTWAIYVGGVLYLVRYDLALVSIGVDLAVLILYRRKLKGVIINVVKSYIPAVVYTLYMYIMSGDLIPTSLSGRAIRSKEDTLSWIEKIKICIRSIHIEYKYIFWLIAVIAVAYFIKCFVCKTCNIKDKRKYLLFTITVIFLVILPHIIYPSVEYFIRYTTGIFVLFMVIVSFFLNELLQLGRIMCFALPPILFIGVIFSVINNNTTNIRKEYCPEQFEICFGKDLNESLTDLGITGGKILTYEIQQQLYLDNFTCISADAIVGNEMTKFMLNEESFSNSIIDNEIQFVVTMPSAIYRECFIDTDFARLYIHGVDSNVGESITLNGVTYKKILDNSASRRIKNSARIPARYANYGIGYGDGEPWDNSFLFWESVYEVQDAGGLRQ